MAGLGLRIAPVKLANRVLGSMRVWSRQRDKALDKKFILLDSHRKELKVAGRDPISFELLSTVHFLRQSKDMHKPRKAIEQRL